MNNVTMVGSFNRACTMGTVPSGDTKAFGLFRPLEDKSMFAVTALGKVADQLATITPDDVVAISGKLSSYEKNVQVFAFNVKVIGGASGSVASNSADTPEATTKPVAKPAKPGPKPSPKPAAPATPTAPVDDGEDI